MNHAARGPRNHERRGWPRPSIFVAGAALFLALGGSAVAATGLIHVSRSRPLGPISSLISKKCST